VKREIRLIKNHFSVPMPYNNMTHGALAKIAKKLTEEKIIVRTP